MNNIIHQITSYLKTHNKSVASEVNIVPVKDKIEYTLIHFSHGYSDVNILVYNSNFISIKIDSLPFAFCDNIKTFRNEIDRLYSLRF
jgi:hypothetical protein